MTGPQVCRRARSLPCVKGGGPRSGSEGLSVSKIDDLSIICSVNGRTTGLPPCLKPPLCKGRWLAQRVGGIVGMEYQGTSSDQEKLHAVQNTMDRSFPSVRMTGETQRCHSDRRKNPDDRFRAAFRIPECAALPRKGSGGLIRPRYARFPKGVPKTSSVFRQKCKHFHRNPLAGGLPARPSLKNVHWTFSRALGPPQGEGFWNSAAAIPFPFSLFPRHSD